VLPCTGPRASSTRTTSRPNRHQHQQQQHRHNNHVADGGGRYRVRLRHNLGGLIRRQQQQYMPRCVHAWRQRRHAQAKVPAEQQLLSYVLRSIDRSSLLYYLSLTGKADLLLTLSTHSVNYHNYVVSKRKSGWLDDWWNHRLFLHNAGTALTKRHRETHHGCSGSKHLVQGPIQSPNMIKRSSFGTHTSHTQTKNAIQCTAT
jgi:hypothetical protein